MAPITRSRLSARTARRGAAAAVVALAVAAGGAATASSAEPATSWGPAADFTSSGKAPSLTSGGERLDGGTSSELVLGLGLMALGLLAVVCALAVGLRRRRARLLPTQYKLLGTDRSPSGARAV